MAGKLGGLSTDKTLPMSNWYGIYKYMPIRNLVVDKADYKTPKFQFLAVQCISMCQIYLTAVLLVKHNCKVFFTL